MSSRLVSSLCLHLHLCCPAASERDCFTHRPPSSSNRSSTTHYRHSLHHPLLLRLVIVVAHCYPRFDAGIITPSDAQSSAFPLNSTAIFFDTTLTTAVTLSGADSFIGPLITFFIQYQRAALSIIARTSTTPPAHVATPASGPIFTLRLAAGNLWTAQHPLLTLADSAGLPYTGPSPLTNWSTTSTSIV